MANTVASIANIVSLYLYGTLEPPADLAIRLRPSTQQAPIVNFDVSSIMASVGKYASLFQTNIVKAFFDNDINLTSFQADDGSVNVSFEQIILAHITKSDGSFWVANDGNVHVDQYTTDISSLDWPFRALVFGRTGFRLSREGTIFHISSDGSKSITGGAMLPLNEDFDMSSTSWIAKLGNYAVIKELIDPYDIAKRLQFSYDNDSAKTYWQSKLGEVHTALDRPSDLGRYVSGALMTPFHLTENVLAVIAGMKTVIDSVSVGADYVHEGRNVIFGTNEMTDLSEASGHGTLFQPGLSSIFVAGESADRIYARGGDTVYGNGGDDKISIDHTYDTHSTDFVTIYGGEGIDKVRYYTIDGETHEEHRDVWRDAAANDLLLFNGMRMSGAAARPFVTGVAEGDDHTAVLATDTLTIAADDNAAYMRFGNTPSELEVAFIGGNSIRIENYQDGIAGINVPVAFSGDYEPWDHVQTAIFVTGRGGSYYAGLHDGIVIEQGPVY